MVAARVLWLRMLDGFERPCVLCAERTAETCHRRLLAETVAEGATVSHIV